MDECGWDESVSIVHQLIEIDSGDVYTIRVCEDDAGSGIGAGGERGRIEVIEYVHYIVGTETKSKIIYFIAILGMLE